MNIETQRCPKCGAIFPATDPKCPSCTVSEPKDIEEKSQKSLKGKKAQGVSIKPIAVVLWVVAMVIVHPWTYGLLAAVVIGVLAAVILSQYF